MHDRSALQVATRIDALIADIRTLQSPHMHSEKGACDVLLVAHGHLLRAFVKRWLNFPLNTELGMMLEPGAVGVLRYVVFPNSNCHETRIVMLIDDAAAISITTRRSRRCLSVLGFLHDRGWYLNSSQSQSFELKGRSCGRRPTGVGCLAGSSI